MLFSCLHPLPCAAWLGLPQNGTTRGQAGGTCVAQRCPGMRHQTIHGRRDSSSPCACFEWDEKPGNQTAAKVLFKQWEKPPGWQQRGKAPRGAGDLACPTQRELGWLWPPAPGAAAGVRGLLAKQGSPMCLLFVPRVSEHKYATTKMLMDSSHWQPSLHTNGQTIPGPHVDGSPGASGGENHCLVITQLLITPALPVPTLTSIQAPLTQGMAVTSCGAGVTSVGQVLGGIIHVLR